MTLPRIEDLVPSVSIANLLAQRDAIIERLRSAATLFREIAELGAVAFPDARYSYAVPCLEDRRTNSGRFPDDLDDFEKSVDATAWDHLLAASGLRTFMDAAARKTWDEAISERKVPALTEENIHATFRELYEQRAAMFEAGVIAVYRSLSWDYKTNSPRRFGRRIILRYAVDVWGSGSKRYMSGPRYETCNKLDDLIRVFCLLDGHPEPDHRQGAYPLLQAVWKSGVRTLTPVELHGVISIRGFGNGNGHVTFLRPDLVDNLNLILAKHYSHSLPPAEG